MRLPQCARHASFMAGLSQQDQAHGLSARLIGIDFACCWNPLPERTLPAAALAIGQSILTGEGNMTLTNRFRTVLVAALLAWGVPIPAAAVVVLGFDGNIGNFAPGPGEYIDSEGFRFTNLEPRSQMALQMVVIDAGAGNNRSPALLSGNDADLLLTAVDGSSFALTDFDFARRPFDTINNRSALVINVIGTLAAGGTVTYQTSLLADDFITAVLPSTFTGLSSVLFAPVVNPNNGLYNYEFMLDNVGVSAVPAPGTLWLLALAPVAAVLVRRSARGAA